jgi:hypothetical protein
MSHKKQFSGQSATQALIFEDNLGNKLDEWFLTKKC